LSAIVKQRHAKVTPLSFFMLLEVAMRKSLSVLVLVALAGASAPPVFAKQQTRYVYDGRSYQTYQQCLNAKKQAEKRGTIVGAATAGVATALLGGNLAETALVAGGGALVGNQLGKNSKKC
jgi:hypothetical protein